MRADSLSEGHYFSISCLLGEHVRAEPIFPDGQPGNVAYVPQELFLLPSSPLIPHINFPPGFDIARTPLVTFLRCDYLMRIESLQRLYEKLHNPPLGSRLFNDENQATSGPEDYLPVFLDPKKHYSTMIVSTAAWWNVSITTLNTIFHAADIIVVDSGTL